MDIDPKFLELIRRERERRRLTQDELGRRVGVSGRQVSRIETGRQDGSVGAVVAIAMVLDIDLNLLKPPDPLETADTELYTPLPETVA